MASFFPQEPGNQDYGMSKTHFFLVETPPRAKKIAKKNQHPQKKHRFDASIMPFWMFVIFWFAAFELTFETQYWASPTLVPAGITSPTRKPEAFL